METMAILELLKEYIILGLKILIPVVIIFFIVYGIVYKKIMKGTKTIKKRKLVLYVISIAYVVIIIGATFLSRFQDSYIYDGEINLNLFNSYREAYHNINVDIVKNKLFRNLILNIMLFIPIGFLIPFYSDKLKKMYRVVLIGFFATLAIELTQHFNNYGVFEIDDIFNNTLGTLLGYCCFMIFHRIKNKESWKKIIGYVIPIILTIGTFIGIFVTYQLQEFGNFEFEHNYAINMKNVKVQSEVEFSKDKSMKDVFYTETLTKGETKTIAENIFKKLNFSIDESRTEKFQNSINYWAKNESEETSDRIEINYIGGTYEYIAPRLIMNADGTVGFMNEIKDANREDVESALEKLGIKITENAKFEIDERNQYIFTVNMEPIDNRFIDGTLTCRYYEDFTVKTVYNNISVYKKVTEKEIISEDEAYKEILNGRFIRYNTKIETITIKDVNLVYKVDSKGYYVPIYEFDVLINGNTNKIYIKAIK